MKRKLFFLWVCLLCSYVWAYGQQLTLSVSDLFSLADSTDLSIEAARNAVEAAQASLDATKKQKLTDLSASASVSYNGDGYMWDRHFQNGMTAEIPAFGNNFAVQASQVIYAGGALKASEDVSSYQLSMSEADLEKNRQDVYFILCGYLLDLVKIDEAIIVYQKNIELANQIIENLKTRMDVGTALANDITRYQIHIDNLVLQYQRLVNTKKILNYNVTTALKLSVETEIIPSVNFGIDSPSLDYSSSPILKKSEIAVSISQSSQKLIKAEMLPQIAVFGSANIDGPVLIEVPVLNKNFFYWYVGVGVKYNFSSLYKAKSKVSSSRYSIQSASLRRESVKEELSKAVFASNIKLEEAEDEISVAEKSLKLSQENYEIVSHRYANGLSLLTDMLDASNIVLSSELKLCNAKVGKLYRYYELLHVSGKLSK